MPRQALSQRQRKDPHEQGMLNVAFTRARDEIHVFHSAPIDTFTMADGSPGTLTRWLQHCAAVQAAGRSGSRDSRLGRIDSEFEGEVADGLRAQGLLVIHQYPSCGFHIDLVCEKDDTRVAVECDGERYHLDEHGQPMLEDLEREAILRRAGWRIERIPYRKWLEDPQGQIQRVLQALDEASRLEPEGQGPTEGGEPEVPPVPSGAPLAASAVGQGAARLVTPVQDAILKALREGLTEETVLFYRVRDLMGARRLTAKLRTLIGGEMQRLTSQGLVAIEDHEYFPTSEGRTAQLVITRAPAAAPRRRYRQRAYRRWR